MENGGGEMKNIKNCMEQFVFEKIERILPEQHNICKCEKCKTDIALLALNKLKPHYVSTDRGDTFTRLALYQKNNEIDILCAIAEAITIVEANPRHDE